MRFLLLFLLMGADWSKPAEGVRARLVATPTTDASHRPQVELALELENVRDVDEGLPIAWGYVGEMLQLEVVDENGKPLPNAGVGGSHMSGPPYVVLLPVSSMLHHTISKGIVEYVNPTHAMIRPLTFQAWNLPEKHGKLYLQGKLVPHPGIAKPGTRAWTTPIELPRIVIPI